MDDICKLTLWLRDPDEILELGVTRGEIVDFFRVINNKDYVFIYIRGEGIPIARITRFTDEDMDGKSVVNPAGYRVNSISFQPDHDSGVTTTSNTFTIIR